MVIDEAQQENLLLEIKNAALSTRVERVDLPVVGKHAF